MYLCVSTFWFHLETCTANLPRGEFKFSISLKSSLSYHLCGFCTYVHNRKSNTNIGTRMFEHSLDASLLLAPNYANVYTWNPYLHTCNPNLQSHHWLHQPTAIAAATAAATIAAATTRFFQKTIVSLKSICLATSSNRGTTPTHLIFSLGFKTTRNLSTLLNF
jgi:hypothetical protein